MSETLDAENLIQEAGDGTALHAWQGSRRLAGVATVDAEQLLAPGQRLVVVAPHPDDEVLCCGGLLAMLRGREPDILMLSVTDGEASHPGSSVWPSHRLRRERPRESAAALAGLGLDVERLGWLRLGLPDTGVAASRERLLAELDEVLEPGDRVITTWRHDGHCDHEAVGAAVADAARRRRARLAEVPVWAWHWAAPEDPRLPWARARKLMLDGQSLERKRRAMAAHASQLHADPSTGQPPVLPLLALARLLQPFELIFL